jgi:hypothetical protein
MHTTSGAKGFQGVCDKKDVTKNSSRILKSVPKA